MEKFKESQNFNHFRQTYLQVVETGHMKIWQGCSHTHTYLRWPSGKSSLNRMSWHLIWAGDLAIQICRMAPYLRWNCFPDDLKEILHSLLVKYIFDYHGIERTAVTSLTLLWIFLPSNKHVNSAGQKACRYSLDSWQFNTSIILSPTQSTHTNTIRNITSTIHHHSCTPLSPWHAIALWPLWRRCPESRSSTWQSKQWPQSTDKS